MTQHDHRIAPDHPPVQPACSRRAMLKAMSSGFGYLAFAGLAAQAAQKQPTGSGLDVREPHFPATARRVIFLCMKGGPSHVDLFDHKPELTKRNGEPGPVGKGGRLLASPFSFSKHGRSGLSISELLPHIAGHADDLCVINSMHTDLPNHPQAFGQLHTGSFQFVRPSLGAWTLYGLGSENERLPGFVTLNPPADYGGARNYGSGFLPAICQGTKLGRGQIPALYAALLKKNREPGPPLKNIENTQWTRDEQRAQLDLVRRLNRRKLERDVHHPEIEGAIASFELAFRMQDEIPEVLDATSEPDHILKLYGIGQHGAGGESDRFASQCLLARRLAEAGVRFIEVTAPTDWDHHQLLKDRLTTSSQITDQPVAALLTDLKQRGMLKDTLVIWAGEFGRTPYQQGGGNGRDHNSRGYTIWMAGGGIRGGISHGSTDELGYAAQDKPVHVHDLHATVLHLLGLDHKRLTFNYGGRDFRLTDVYGNVVKDILG